MSDGFEVISGAASLWGRADGTGGARRECTLAVQDRALGAVVAHWPAEPGAHGRRPAARGASPGASRVASCTITWGANNHFVSISLNEVFDVSGMPAAALRFASLCVEESCRA